jgi:hypothetical protein
MSQPKVPDRARKYKEEPAPVAQKMVSCLCFLAPTAPSLPRTPILPSAPEWPSASSTVVVSSVAPPNRHRQLPPRSLHAAAATARRGHPQRVTPAPARLCLHGMPFPPSSPATQAPPPLSSLSALKPVRRLLSRKAQQRNPCHQASAPTAGPLCVVNVARWCPAFFSLPFPSYKLYPTVLSLSRPCPSPTSSCRTSSPYTLARQPTTAARTPTILNFLALPIVHCFSSFVCACSLADQVRL